MIPEGKLSLCLNPERLLGGLEREAGEAPLSGAVWYSARAVGDGLEYRFPAGALAAARYLTADMLLDGLDLAVFQLTLQEGEEGPAFLLVYQALNQAPARIRMPLEAVKQNRWLLGREGAWLKPHCSGERVDLEKVDRARITVLRNGGRPVRWCLTPLTATAEEPPRLTEPLLPKGPLLDAQLAAASAQRWPESFSRWGGLRLRVQGSKFQVQSGEPHDLEPGTLNLERDRRKPFAATGFFRTHHDGQRWRLVDPDGHPF